MTNNANIPLNSFVNYNGSPIQNPAMSQMNSQFGFSQIRTNYDYEEYIYTSDVIDMYLDIAAKILSSTTIKESQKKVLIEEVLKGVIIKNFHAQVFKYIISKTMLINNIINMTSTDDDKESNEDFLSKVHDYKSKLAGFAINHDLPGFFITLNDFIEFSKKNNKEGDILEVSDK